MKCETKRKLNNSLKNEPVSKHYGIWHVFLTKVVHFKYKLTHCPMANGQKVFKQHKYNLHLKVLSVQCNFPQKATKQIQSVSVKRNTVFTYLQLIQPFQVYDQQNCYLHKYFNKHLSHGFMVLCTSQQLCQRQYICFDPYFFIPIKLQTAYFFVIHTDVNN